MSVPRFAGELVELGGATYMVPPLSMLAIKTLLPKIQQVAMGTEGNPSSPLAQFDDLIDLCLAALKRNYPALTRDELLELVDPSNFVPLIRTVLRQSALVSVQEKNGVAVGSRFTGPASMADSPPHSDGAGSTSTST